MEKRQLGSFQVSVVGLGCNNFGWRTDAAGTERVVDAAIEAGINFFDTADVYGGGKSEEYLGRALGSLRKKVVVATKFGLPMDERRRGAKPAYIREAVEDSLRRLGTDYIDLYQLHKPDPETPIGDTLETLNDLVRAGKTREIGCSNFSAAQLREAEAAVKAEAARFISVQNHFSLLHREPEAEVLPECERLGLGFIPYFPLENGLLTGKYRAGQALPEGSRAKDGFGPKIFTDQNIALAEALEKFATSRQHTLLELAISWLAAQSGVVSIIAGAKNSEQIRANASAAAWKLTPEEVEEIDGILNQPA
ncbi:MAG TPA: aldo/keto reductase [Bryobacteraceae bacterium]|jgi:aryl-alcohol dehydrogenase-like predicted oxidoreductase